MGICAVYNPKAIFHRKYLHATQIPFCGGVFILSCYHRSAEGSKGDNYYDRRFKSGGIP